MEVMINKTLLVLLQGDITKEKTTAIVNAANSALRGGAGVDGAIHKAGGPEIMAECRRIGSCPPGSAVITTGGNLKASYVIHATGPVWQGGTKGEAETLAGAYLASLRLASRHKMESLSFPAISTGAYGFPLREAAEIAVTTIVDYLRANSGLAEVRVVLFDRNTYEVFAGELERLCAGFSRESGSKADA